MEQRCPHTETNCTFVAKSNKALEHHLVFSHDAFSSNENVMEAALRSFTKIRDMVHFLLMKFPSCRSNDKLLYEKVLQYYSPYVIYDATTKTIRPRNPNGWTFQEWLSFPSYETARRARQFLQRKFPELKASEIVQQERKLKEEAYHSHFASEKLSDSDYLGNTHVPGASQ